MTVTHLILPLVIIVIVRQSRSLSSQTTHSPTVQTNINTLDNESQSMFGHGVSEYKALQPLLLSPKDTFHVTTDRPLDDVQHHVSSTTLTQQDEHEREQTIRKVQKSVYKPLNLRSNKLNNCVLENGHLHYVAIEGQLYLRHNKRTPVVTQKHTCNVTVTASDDRVFRMQIRLFSTLLRAGVSVSAFDEGTNPPRKLFDTSQHYCGVQGFDLYSFTNKVTFQYVLLKRSSMPLYGEPFHMNLTFVAVPSSDKLNLEVIQTTPMAGYIKTPNYTVSSPYPINIESWARLHVPEGHAVMLSFSHLDMDNKLSTRCTTVKVHRISNLTERQVWDYSSWEYFHPAVLVARTVEVYVYTFMVYGRSTGFRLMFSFHNLSEIPQKLPDGKWNCSVPYWADFQQHFPCNLIWDCEGGEDEVNCPYTSRACGLDYVPAGGSCFLYVSVPRDVRLSLDDASDECQRRGLQLASLNTPAEWDDVTRLLEMRHKLEPTPKTQKVYIGLTSAHPSIPYQKTYQWADGTIAHNTRGGIISRISVVMRACGFLSTGGTYQAHVGLCRSNDYSGILCEKEAVTSDDLLLGQDMQKIRLPVLDTRLTMDNFVTCPKNHTAHDFLACDVKSGCWGKGYGPSYVCDAPMTPLPPSLACASGMEFVPYTLVCDHRPDCEDGSDEEFCVFPPCDPLEQTRCGDGQVSFKKSSRQDRSRVWTSSS
ncbi:hypothetical protein BaRGS_00015312, partial [Batillaria attramentaria]